jgi:hypothetical protein
MTRVFQIGFNKCGTRSLYRLFADNSIPSLHWHTDQGKIAKKMLINFLNGEYIIPKEYESIIFFSDLEDVYGSNYLPIFSYRFYREIFYQFPDAKFILNTRPLDEWINSRVEHDNGKYLNHCLHTLKISKLELINQWKSHFLNHSQEVKMFFKNKREKLLIFDISKDNVSKVINFFPELNLQPKYWQKISKGI